MESIKATLEDLNTVKIDSLERKGRDYHFSDVHSLTKTIFENIKIFQNNPEFWEQLPKDKEENIKNCVLNFHRYIDEMHHFTPHQQNPLSNRDKIANNIRNSYDEFYEHLFPLLKLFMLEKEMSNKKPEGLIKQAEKSVKQVEEAISAVQQQKQQGENILQQQRKQGEEILQQQRKQGEEILQQQEKQGEEILKVSRKASAITGVSRFAGVFEKQAKWNGIIAIIWLILSAISAVVIGYFLWQIFDQSIDVIKDEKADFQISLQIFLAKILLLSFFSVIFFQVVKNYNANMHLFTLNKHRANSLLSFEAFVKSTEDPKIRDTVLIQATKAIFEAGESGYVASKEGTITGMETIKIVDQIKGKSPD